MPGNLTTAAGSPTPGSPGAGGVQGNRMVGGVQSWR
jgi:hypothetical protein